MFMVQTPNFKIEKSVPRRKIDKNAPTNRDYKITRLMVISLNVDLNLTVGQMISSSCIYSLKFIRGA